MDRTKIAPETVERLNKEANPEAGGDRRGTDARDAAMRPASGAAINRAFAGASMAGEDRSGETGETADALKRAAGNDRRV